MLLFDFSGVLADHTSQPRSSGTVVFRPGLEHLSRLASRFELGICTSCSDRTLETWLPELRKVAGNQELFQNRRLHLTRKHTQEAPEHIKRLAGKDWETVKSLWHMFTPNLFHRVLLVDADGHKVRSPATSVGGYSYGLVPLPCSPLLHAAQQWLQASCLVLFSLVQEVDGISGPGTISCDWFASCQSQPCPLFRCCLVSEHQ